MDSDNVGEGTILKAYDGFLGYQHLDIELTIDAEYLDPEDNCTVAEIETHYVVTTLSHIVVGIEDTCSTTSLMSTRHHQLETAQACLTGVVSNLVSRGAQLFEREL